MTASRPRVPAWLRILIPAILIVGWLAAAGIGGPVFGKLSDVVSNDQTSFLPASAEATQVQGRLGGFLGDDEVPAIVVVASDDALTEQQLQQIDALAESLAGGEHIIEASPAIPSDDGLAAEIIAIVDGADGNDALSAAVTSLRSIAADAGLDDALTVEVTGPAGFSADIVEAFGGIDGLLLIVAVLAVFVILVIVYRSPLLPVLVLLTSVSALCLSILVVYQLALAGLLTLSGQTQGILFILVIGAATDYALLYTSRFREALTTAQRRWDATVAAWKGAFEPILASGGTVIAGLLCLLLSDLVSN